MTAKLHRSLILEALVALVALDAKCAQRGITGEIHIKTVYFVQEILASLEDRA
jgi:hypothetical protein